MFSTFLKKSRLLLIFGLTLIVVSQSSCKRKAQKDVRYFKNAFDTTVTMYKYQDYKFKIDDVLAIQIIAGSLRQEDAALYNLPVSVEARSGTAATYRIDSLGYINLPKVGKIKASELTKEQLARSIENLLVDEVKNPFVLVRLATFKVNVLGEVKKPGPVIIKTDKANFLDALIEAGDLNDYAKRDEILLTRPNNGKYETFKIDLTNVAFINSPAFQLYPDDVIYVRPTDRKNRLLDERANFLRELSIILSSLTGIIYLFYSIGLIKR